MKLTNPKQGLPPILKSKSRMNQVDERDLFVYTRQPYPHSSLSSNSPLFSESKGALMHQ